MSRLAADLFHWLPCGVRIDSNFSLSLMENLCCRPFHASSWSHCFHNFFAFPYLAKVNSALQTPLILETIGRAEMLTFKLPQPLLSWQLPEPFIVLGASEVIGASLVLPLIFFLFFPLLPVLFSAPSLAFLLVLMISAALSEIFTVFRYRVTSEILKVVSSSYFNSTMSSVTSVLISQWPTGVSRWALRHLLLKVEVCRLDLWLAIH